jgi:hypothetical protein
MGISPIDLINNDPAPSVVPTFAQYVPVVSAAVPSGSRRAYGSYWNKVVEYWGDRRLDEPTPSEIQGQSDHMRANVIVRRNSRGGRSAAENYGALPLQPRRRRRVHQRVRQPSPQGNQAAPAATKSTSSMELKCQVSEAKSARAKRRQPLSVGCPRSRSSH